MFLKIIAFLFITIGFIMVMSAKWAVKKFKLDNNANKSIDIDFSDEMSKEELEQYVYNKAVVNFKMLGMLVALPGIVMILIIY